MLNLFWKVSIMVLTVNAFLFFLLGSTFGASLQGQWTWIPTTMRDANVTITNQSQITPQGFTSSDTNYSVDAGTTASTQTVPYYFSFLSAATLIYNLGFYLMFGYFIWMQYLLPLPLVIAVSIPILFIQMIALFYLLQSFVGTFTSIVSFFR